MDPGCCEEAPPLQPCERWTPPDFSDLEQVARNLELACPDAGPVAPLRPLGEGFFSVALATASGAVFRLATGPDVFARYQKEWRVLPWLARQDLPLAIPRPRWLIEPAGGFPFGGIGYPLIEGRTLTEADVAGPQRAHIAEQIAAFNLALHRLPIEEALALRVPDGRVLDRRWDEADRDVVRVALVSALPAQEYAAVEEWWRAYFERLACDGAPLAFQHGDIGDENLLVAPDGSRLVAVIDFEHCAVGDRLDDFCNLQYLGRDFCREALEAYARQGGAVPGGVEERLEWHWQRGAFPSIRRAWQRGEPLDVGTVRASLLRHRVLR